MAIHKNSIISISQPRIIRFRSNLVRYTSAGDMWVGMVTEIVFSRIGEF